MWWEHISESVGYKILKIGRHNAEVMGGFLLIRHSVDGNFVLSSFKLRTLVVDRMLMAGADSAASVDAQISASFSLVGW